MSVAGSKKAEAAYVGMLLLEAVADEAARIDSGLEEGIGLAAAP